MDTSQEEHPPNKRKRKAADDPIKKKAVVITGEDVNREPGSNEVPMPTTITLAEINKDEMRRKEISFTLSKTKEDMKKILKETFPILAGTERFYCAKSAGKVKLDFGERRCIWSGKEINRIIKGDSVLYIFCEGEQLQDSGAFSTDSEQSEAHITLPPVGPNTAQITKMVPVTLALAPQPILPTGDLLEQIKTSTLVPQMENLQISSEDTEIQNSYDQASTETFTANGIQSGQQHTPVTVGRVSHDQEENSDQHPPLIAQVENMQISRDESLSEDHSDSGVETCNNSQAVGHNLESEENMQDSLSRNSPNNAEVEQRNQDVVQETSHSQVEVDGPNHIAEQEQYTSRNGDPLLSSTIRTSSPKPDEYRSNIVVETIFPINKELKEISSDYAIVPSLAHPQVEGDEPNHIVEQEQSHPQMDVEEPNQNVEQEQLVRTICPSSSHLEGGGNFQISLKEELPEHIQSGYASFGNVLVVLTKFNKLTLAGAIPAAQEPGVVKVRVYLDAGEFLGETNFEYEDILDTVAFQAVQLGPDGLSRLFALMGKHMWNQRSSATQSSSAKQNSGQATGALNDSCQDRSSPVENTVMDDEYEDLVQHFQDFVKWLSEPSLHPIHSNTDTWLKLSNAVDGLCRKLACSEDEENFKGNQQTCSQEREENYFADAENSSCMSSEDDSASLSDPDNWSETFNACTEAEEDLEGDQLTCTQKRDENYFPNTEDYSSVSSETDSALSDSESWDESISDSSLSVSWVNSRSNKSLEAIPETESTQNSYKAVNSKLNLSHEILELMTEGFTSEDSIGNNNYVGSVVCHKWNTSLPESKKTEENCEKDDHNKMQDSSREWAFFSDGITSDIQLASHDDTPVLCLDALDLIVENEESQYQDNELFEAPHAENAKPKDSESILSVTSNQQSATHAGPTTQSQAAQSPVSNPLWNGDSKLNMAPPQCSDEEIHSGQEWEESGEGLASWSDLCENEDAGKNEHSRCEMSSIEPNKTDGGVEKDVFDSEEDLSREQRLFSEQGNSHIHLSLPDYTFVRSRYSFAGRFIMFPKNNPLCGAARNGHTNTVRLLIENGADVYKERDPPLSEAARNGHTDTVRLLIENGADVNKEEWNLQHTPLTAAVTNGHTDIVWLLIQNGADVNKRSGILRHTPLTEAVINGHTDIVWLLIQNGAYVNKGRGILGQTLLTHAVTRGHTDIVWLLIQNGVYVNKGRGVLGHTLLTEAVTKGHTDIVWLLIQNGANVNNRSGSDLRRKFEADARDAKLSLERELNIQLRGKKIASLPKRLGKKLKTQTEMTSPRDIVEEGKCGKDMMTDVELSPRCVQFKPFIMEESPGDSSIMHHDFKTINKRMDRVTLTYVGNAEQDHCVVVEKAITHPSGATIIIYGRKINEEGSGVGEVFRLATKNIKHTWDDEEVIAENVQIGSVVKYVQVGDKFLFQGNTKRPRWNMDKIFLDLSRADGAHRGFGDAFLNSKILAEDSYQDCTPKETSCFISLKCGVVENDRISVITELGELFNLKLNCRDAILPLSPSTLELSHVEDNKDAVDSAVVEMEEPLLISGVDGLSKPSYPVLGEGLNLRDEPKEKKIEVDNPEADPVEKDDENGKASLPDT